MHGDKLVGSRYSQRMSIADSALPAPQQTLLRHRAGLLAAWTVLTLLLLGVGAGWGYYQFGKRSLSPTGGRYFFTRTELPVTLFLQGDDKWADDHLGNSPRTMAQVGCAVTSAAMIMKFYGLDTDPGRLNTFLLANGGYDENNDLRWEGPAALAPTKVKHVYEDLPSYHLIDSNLEHGNPVIVRLSLPSGWTHFVVIMGKQGFDYLIRDPSKAGLRKGVYPLKEIGSKIYALRYYEKLPPVAQ